MPERLSIFTIFGAPLEVDREERTMQAESRPTGSRFLENLAYIVPGYQGYKDPANRREEDSRLRARILQRLASIQTGLTSMIAAASALDAAPNLTEGFDERAQRIGGIADAVRYAPYGFSGFFDALDVREDSLERILEADLLLFRDLEALEAVLDRPSLPFRAGPRRAAFLSQIDEAMNSLECHLILRDKILGDC
jgi:hypothetical protein